MEGMYRPLRRSEILPELEYHETRELIDRNEQPGAAALGVDPAWRHTQSVPDDLSAVFDPGLCPDRYENASHTLAVVHGHEAKGSALYN